MDVESNPTLGSGRRRNAFSIIKRCCDEVTIEGIPLVRGASFHWGKGKMTPEACSALGAVLWRSGSIVFTNIWPYAHTPKPWTTLCKLLGVDFFWLYRFCIGWDNRTQLVVYTEKDGQLIAHQDEVSRLAIQMSKERTK